jgi:hypothetical protein
MIPKAKKAKKRVATNTKTSSTKNKIQTPVPVLPTFDQYVQEKYQEKQQQLRIERIKCDEEIDKIEKSLHVIQNSTSRGYIRAKCLLKQQLQTLRQRIMDIDSGEELRFYEKQIELYAEAFVRENQIQAMKQLQAKTSNLFSSVSHANSNSTSTASSNIVSASHVAPSDDVPENHKILREYQQQVEHLVPETKIMPHEICEECEDTMVLEPTTSALLCPMCGNWRSFLDATSSHLAYGDEMEFTTFSYLPLNHFNELLTYAQAQETAKIPEHKVMMVAEQIWEQGIHDIDAITLDHTYNAMKALKMHEHYKQNTQMWCRITGKPPLRMTPAHEEKLRKMFKAVSKVWPKYKPAGRKNIPSYGFLLYRFNELLGYDEFLPLFRLLKGPKKLSIQNQMFEKICADEELRWNFRAPLSQISVDDT